MTRLIALFFLLIVVSATASAQKVYRWVDENGNVHFGDRVPPEYAEQVFGKPAADQAETPESAAAAQQAKDDRVLLMTYLSVDEIVAVRDRRIDQMRSRGVVTQRYLDSLNERLAKLQREEKLWSGRVANGDAEEVPPAVISEMASTRESIADYEGRMANSALEQQNILDKFARDITRFRELKGLPPEPEGASAEAEAQPADLTTTTAQSGAE